MDPREAQIELSDSKLQHFDFALGHGPLISLAHKVFEISQ